MFFKKKKKEDAKPAVQTPISTEQVVVEMSEPAKQESTVQQADAQQESTLQDATHVARIEHISQKLIETKTKQAHYELQQQYDMAELLRKNVSADPSDKLVIDELEALCAYKNSLSAEEWAKQCGRAVEKQNKHKTTPTKRASTPTRNIQNQSHILEQEKNQLASMRLELQNKLLDAQRQKIFLQQVEQAQTEKEKLVAQKQDALSKWEQDLQVKSQVLEEKRSKFDQESHVFENEPQAKLSETIKEMEKKLHLLNSKLFNAEHEHQKEIDMLRSKYLQKLQGEGIENKNVLFTMNRDQT